MGKNKEKAKNRTRCICYIIPDDWSPDQSLVKILTAVLSDGLTAVETACGEALVEGVHSADVILNILARRKDPEPALTIATPEALKLKHQPVADCARYDQLRGAP